MRQRTCIGKPNVKPYRATFVYETILRYNGTTLRFGKRLPLPCVGVCCCGVGNNCIGNRADVGIPASFTTATLASVEPDADATHPS